jgi:hypothetical protein
VERLLPSGRSRVELSWSACCRRSGPGRDCPSVSVSPGTQKARVPPPLPPQPDSPALVLRRAWFDAAPPATRVANGPESVREDTERSCSVLCPRSAGTTRDCPARGGKGGGALARRGTRRETDSPVAARPKGDRRLRVPLHEGVGSLQKGERPRRMHARNTAQPSRLARRVMIRADGQRARPPRSRSRSRSRPRPRPRARARA